MINKTHFRVIYVYLHMRQVFSFINVNFTIFVVINNWVLLWLAIFMRGKEKFDWLLLNFYYLNLYTLYKIIFFFMSIIWYCIKRWKKSAESKVLFMKEITRGAEPHIIFVYRPAIYHSYRPAIYHLHISWTNNTHTLKINICTRTRFVLGISYGLDTWLEATRYMVQILLPSW